MNLIPVCRNDASFKDAFWASRKEKASEFIWRGSKYHTRTAEEDWVKCSPQKPIIIGWEPP